MLSIVRATHVCRHWRNLILNEHAIWAKEVGIIPKAVSTFLERSGPELPVHLYMGKRSFAPTRHVDAVPMNNFSLRRVHLWKQVLWGESQLEAFYKFFCDGLLSNLQTPQVHAPCSPKTREVSSIIR